MPRPGYGLPRFELTVLQGAGDQLAGIRAYPDRGQSLDGFVTVVETLAELEGGICPQALTPSSSIAWWGDGSGWPVTRIVDPLEGTELEVSHP